MHERHAAYVNSMTKLHLFQLNFNTLTCKQLDWKYTSFKGDFILFDQMDTTKFVVYYKDGEVGIIGNLLIGHVENNKVCMQNDNIKQINRFSMCSGLLNGRLFAFCFAENEFEPFPTTGLKYWSLDLESNTVVEEFKFQIQCDLDATQFIVSPCFYLGILNEEYFMIFIQPNIKNNVVERASSFLVR